jgi:5-keto 4-deoxyuronate isomerase
MNSVKDGQKFNIDNSGCVIRELFNQDNSNLCWLSAADMRISSGASPMMGCDREEILLANLGQDAEIRVGDTIFELKHYDMLYIPVGASWQASKNSVEDVHLYVYRALGDEVYEPYHAKYEECIKDEERIRYLERKVVYKMFDVSEKANKFMVGYTFYEDRTRAYPPHNHTDQEEVYSFIEGRGAMEVYEDEKNKTFVRSVETGDHITIPVLNYHPVFSHEEPLCFIWCIAGERYWVGDKNKDFMDASVDKLTT